MSRWVVGSGGPVVGVPFLGCLLDRRPTPRESPRVSVPAGVAGELTGLFAEPFEEGLAHALELGPVVVDAPDEVSRLGRVDDLVPLAGGRSASARRASHRAPWAEPSSCSRLPRLNGFACFARSSAARRAPRAARVARSACPTLWAALAAWKASWRRVVVARSSLVCSLARSVRRRSASAARCCASRSRCRSAWSNRCGCGPRWASRRPG